MAILKMGAIVTNIVGSIGGTTFKRNGNSNVIMNKPIGTSYSKLLLNKQLNGIRAIFQQWASITSVVRTAWNAAALLYTFPDKFGVMRNISGRQFFNKLNIQLLPVGSLILSPDGISNHIGSTTVSNFILSSAPFAAALDFTIVDDDCWVLVQIEVSQKKLFSPIFSRRKITAFVHTLGTETIDLTTGILEQFPFINSTYNVRAYVTLMNDWGFKNVPVHIDGVWS